MTDKEAHLRQQYLHAMGIEQWVLRDVFLDSDSIKVPPAEARPKVSLQQAEDIESHSGINPNDDASNLDWAQLQLAVQNCTACALSETRTQAVFGSGHPQAQLMIVGEAPGADEDRQGLPFVGKAGQLLTEMLLAIGFKRDQVFIANSLKCRPPNNRNPSQPELACCEPFLKRQIDLIQPKAILVLGRVAAHNILKSTDSLAKMRGQHQLADQNIPVYVSYHPAYLLRSPSDKAKTWQDLKQVLQLVKQAV